MYEESVKYLNRAVADELAAIHQYMYFHFQLDDQGLGRMALMFKQNAIAEMIHLERLAERILFLKGDVEMKAIYEAKQIHDPVEMLKFACKAETDAIKLYNDFAKKCGESADSNTKKLFEDLVTDEEDHYDQFDTELEKIDKYGASYLALQSMGGDGTDGGAGGGGA